MSLLERIRQFGTADAVTVAPERSERKARVKRDLMERVGYAEAARIAAIPDVAQARAELRPALVAVLNTAGCQDLAPEERGRLEREILDEIVGLGPLQPLLEDDSVSELMVNGLTSCYFEREGKLHRMERVFESEEQIMVAIDRIISPLGRRVDERSPIVNARLKNGFRVNAIIPPVAVDGPALTIRKFSDRISSLEELVSLGSLPAWYAQLLSWAVSLREDLAVAGAQLLSWAVSLREDLAVAGGTGSGKTTLLNALSCEIGEGERIVTIEDSAELKFARHPHVVRLEAREASIEGEGEITIRTLVANALRMRPDRIVVGEVRGAEAIDMLQAMNTGHDGSLTTLHAGTAEEAVVCLTLLARYGIDLPSELIEAQIASALDGVVMTVRTARGERYVGSYTGVCRAKSGGVDLKPYVVFDRRDCAWRLEEEPPFVAEAVRRGALDEEEVLAWYAELPS